MCFANGVPGASVKLQRMRERLALAGTTQVIVVTISRSSTARQHLVYEEDNAKNFRAISFSSTDTCYRHVAPVIVLRCNARGRKCEGWRWEVADRDWSALHAAKARAWILAALAPPSYRCPGISNRRPTIKGSRRRKIAVCKVMVSSQMLCPQDRTVQTV